MLARLHPGHGSADFEAEIAGYIELPDPYVCFLAFDDGGEPIGMIDARVRNYAEGAPNLTAAYVEDLWVEPMYRRSGVATALLAAVEEWATGEGFDWLGSDTQDDNQVSQAWHSKAGFAEIERIVVFGKPLN